ncbi:hypothetical protein [Salmonella phage SD-1_S14]|nr:hypothetical protein [Salmonella phage SD-1_S14]
MVYKFTVLDKILQTVELPVLYLSKIHHFRNIVQSVCSYFRTDFRVYGYFVKIII